MRLKQEEENLKRLSEINKMEKIPERTAAGEGKFSIYVDPEPAQTTRKQTNSFNLSSRSVSKTTPNAFIFSVSVFLLENHSVVKTRMWNFIHPC